MNSHNNLSNEKDDSHSRWDKQADTDFTIWNYYNEFVATNIITSLIKKKNITLADLYQKVALIRAECEWIKKYVSDKEIENVSDITLENIAKSNLFTSFLKICQLSRWQFN